MKHLFTFLLLTSLAFTSCTEDMSDLEASVQSDQVTLAISVITENPHYNSESQSCANVSHHSMRNIEVVVTQEAQVGDAIEFRSYSERTDDHGIAKFRELSVGFYTINVLFADQEITKDLRISKPGHKGVLIKI